MANRIIAWSTRNPFFVLLVVSLLVLTGWWSAKNIPLDAIPDLSETQVIIHAKWDRSPDIMENQVTHPIVTAMLGAPKVMDVRGISDFGASYIYVIFEDGTDMDWARSRTAEYLSKALPQIPAEVKAELGPDASGLGWVFQYALVDSTGRYSLAELRSLQDWYLRYHLQATPGVAEVASLGGFVRQYQINLDPVRLQAYHISTAKVIAAVRANNAEVGGRLVESGGREYMVRGRGYIRTTDDLSQIALVTSPEGVPVRVSDVGSVVLGPELRRGAADLDGKGEVVSGIVIMRQGQNALTVIDRVKHKLKDLQSGLPPGVALVTVYDRSELILRTIENLRSTLIEELIVVSIVILIFLWHFPSAIIPILTIPIAVLIAFLPMRLAGTTANVMSLGGIAIAVGAMVDAAIVVAEHTHKKIAEWEASGKREDFRSVVVRAVQQVGGPSFFSLLVIAVAFLPVLALQAQEGRLFKPLAFTKSFSMITAAVLAITLDPALRVLFTRKREFAFGPRIFRRAANFFLVGKFHSEERHPISRFLIGMYLPMVEFSLRWRWVVIGGAVLLIVMSVPIYLRLGSEFMPPLDEGSLLFMPVTLPGISLTEAHRLLQAQDRIIASFPEVERVTGKVGRAETATDPAPPSMAETVILLKPKNQWPKVRTWYTRWPEWLKPVLRHISPDYGSTEELVSRMEGALHAPGVSNGWTMPIRNRIEMQSTGIRTPVGVKVMGPDFNQIQSIGRQVEAVLSKVPGTRNAYAERTGEGYFLDFDLKRDELARYGLTVDDAQMVISSAIGGEDVTTVIEGPARYPVNVRYFPDFRSGPEELARVTVPVVGGHQEVPLSAISNIRVVSGPSMLRDENGMLTGYVYADFAGRDVGSYVEESQRVVRERVKLPPGYALIWSGQAEMMERMKDRLKVVLPVTIFLVALLLYWNTHSVAKTLLVLLAVPFSTVGAVGLIYALGYNMSIATWVGLIALMGIDAETGIFMLLYLDLACEERRKAGRLQSRGDLRQAIIDGAAKRIRPKFMTVTAMIAGLAPIMWSAGPGADVLKRIAAPLIGGIVTSFLLELMVYPALYEVWRWGGDVARSVPSPAELTARG